MVTFRVDDVQQAAETLPTQPLSDRFPAALVVGGDPHLPVIEPDGVHPLLSAIGRAFADHHPLVLSPDAVWLTIMQGLAQHVRLHAEELRPRLVSHAGRKRLTVVVDGVLPQDADSWRDAVELFDKLLLTEVKQADDFECDFTTSTHVEKVAGRIALLDAYSPYFSLWMMFICGIPSITLTGTGEAGLICTVIDLADGRSIAAVLDLETRSARWIVCRVEEVVTERQGRSRRGFRLVGDPADIRVYGTSLALLLDAALDSGGDISHLETGRLDRLGPA